MTASRKQMSVLGMTGDGETKGWYNTVYLSSGPLKFQPGQLRLSCVKELNTAKTQLKFTVFAVVLDASDNFYWSRVAVSGDNLVTIQRAASSLRVDVSPQTTLTSVGTPVDFLWVRGGENTPLKTTLRFESDGWNSKKIDILRDGQPINDAYQLVDGDAAFAVSALDGRPGRRDYTVRIEVEFTT
ncbi:hypothetical protein QFB08_003666 [Salmonella enterica]|nr:hypothetical protein [Salmonella enterica subsp. enterica]EKY7109926.1 hypothetical protein [Salmonella enterica]